MIEAAQALERAERLMRAIIRLFRRRDRVLYREHYPGAEDEFPVSYLWSYSALFSAVNALLKCHAGGSRRGSSWFPVFGNVLKGLACYRDAVREPAGYQDLPISQRVSDRYYDDNCWVAMEDINGYENTRDPGLLANAEETYRFIASGWTDELGGGIYWCEQKKATKNACSNAPAAVVALRLFRHCGNRRYMDDARRLYEWTRQALQDEDGLLFDHVGKDGTIDPTKYTYNAGAMISASCLFHECAGGREYLQEAERIAEASLRHFGFQQAPGVVLLPSVNVWFNAVLVRGLMDLYAINGDPSWLDPLFAGADHAWEKARDAQGLLNADWSGQETSRRKWLLEQASMVEIYATEASYRELQRHRGRGFRARISRDAG